MATTWSTSGFNYLKTNKQVDVVPYVTMPYEHSTAAPLFMNWEKLNILSLCSMENCDLNAVSLNNTLQNQEFITTSAPKKRTKGNGVIKLIILG